MNLADRVLKFAEKLTITSGRKAGEPMVVLPHIEAAISGTLRPGVRTACISWPRKQSKSTGYAAVLIAAGLVGPLSVPRGQLATGSASRDQASLIFDETAAFFRSEPELYPLVNISESRKMITSLLNGSTFKALSADATTAHGLGLDLFILDEAAQQRDSNLWDVLFTSQSARKNPRAIAIGTRSQDQHHFFSKMIDYGLRVNAGEFEDPSFFCHVLSAPEDADWLSEDIWRAVNPCIDAGVQDIVSLRELAHQAKRIPSKESVFRALHLNQAVSADDRAIGSVDWSACGGVVDVESLRGRPCWGGLDLGSTTDLSSLTLYFPKDGGAVLCWFWCPKDRLEEREHKDRVPYLQWSKAGLLEATPGRAVDKAFIARKMAEATSMFDIQGIAYDRWRIEDLQVLLDNEGIELPLVGFGQGFASMSPAVDAFEAELLAGNLRHGDHPILTWNASNLVYRFDPAGNRKPDKARSRERVDGLVALIMAMGLYSREPAVVEYDFDRPLVLSA